MIPTIPNTQNQLTVLFRNKATIYH